MSNEVKTVADFDREVVEASKTRPVVVIVSAPWCGPCKIVKPILIALSEKHDFPLVNIDGSQQRELAQHLKVRSVPTMFIYRDGEEVKRWAGTTSEAELTTVLARAGVLR